MQVDDRVTRNRSRPRDVFTETVRAAGTIGIVLVAVQVRAGSYHQVGAEVPASRLVAEDQPAGVPRYERDAIAGANLNIPVGIGRAVGVGTHCKVRLKGGIDEAVHQLPVPAALPAAQRQVESLTARVADIGKVAGVGRGGDELNVIAV